MIRSCRIPAVLNRICDEQIPTAMLVTLDGELLGTSNINSNNNNNTVNPVFGTMIKDADSFGTLLADIAVEYKKLGDEYAAASDTTTTTTRTMDTLLLHFDSGATAAVAACPTIDCFVLAVATPGTPPGLLRARLRSLADHVQESMSLLMESQG
eukprot:scaffold1690_cov182-Amphora_coffeaeformis.AAC.78